MLRSNSLISSVRQCFTLSGELLGNGDLEKFVNAAFVVRKYNKRPLLKLRINHNLKMNFKQALDLK